MSKAGYQKKRRNTGDRQRKKLIVISTEGKNKTETLYFKRMLQQTWSVISAKGNDTDPIQIAKHLRDEMQDCGFDPGQGDLAFAFVDHDLKLSKDAEIALAEKLLAETDGKLIVSNPCFEVWLFAHLRFTTRGFKSSGDVIDALNEEMMKKGLGGYSKEDPHTYDKLKHGIADAIQNAKRMEDECHQAGRTYHKHDFSPSTDVYKVIVAIEER